MMNDYNNWPVVYETGNLEVRVDACPIGGFRGKVGTLSINHKENKVFTDWEQEDLEDLAVITQKALKIQEDEQVTNTLLYAKQQEKESFKLSLIVYPECGYYEKLMGLIHVLMGSPQLKQEEMNEISDFYSPKFAQEIVFPPQPELEVKNDPFCRQEVIDKQCIAHLEPEEGYHYNLLHDNRPKGTSIEDPHFLIVPEKEAGHLDGSQVPTKQRFHMLQTMQKAMNYFLEDGFPTLVLIERNGEKLRGVQHTHDHAMGIKNFPNKSLDIFFAFLKLAIWSHQLSVDQLNAKIDKYKEYKWDLN